jgi:hypothetical protein
VSPLYLYAVLGAAPSPASASGMANEPVRFVRCAGVIAAAGEMSEAPGASAETLRGHDAVVRRLAETAEAILPARFGALAADEHDLCARLTHGGDALREALARVAGREQMILRIYRRSADRASGVPDAASTSPEEGPGARYLAERARAYGSAATAEELTPIRPVLDRFVTAERVERHQTPPLVASVYHLIARGSAGAYAAAVEGAARDLTDVGISVSGPWAPYAFAPESLG